MLNQDEWEKTDEHRCANKGDVIWCSQNEAFCEVDWNMTWPCQIARRKQVVENPADEFINRAARRAALNKLADLIIKNPGMPTEWLMSMREKGEDWNDGQPEKTDVDLDKAIGWSSGAPTKPGAYTVQFSDGPCIERVIANDGSVRDSAEYYGDIVRHWERAEFPAPPQQWTEGTPGDGVWVVHMKQGSYRVVVVSGEEAKPYNDNPDVAPLFSRSDIIEYHPFTPPAKAVEELEPPKWRKVEFDGKQYHAVPWGEWQHYLWSAKAGTLTVAVSNDQLTFLDKEPG